MLKLLLTSAVLTVAAPLAAIAQTAPDRVLVHTADLDLGSTTGARMLDQRIARAADTICSSDWNIDLIRRTRVARCRRAAIASAAGQRDQALAASSRRSTVAALSKSDRADKR